MERKKTVAEGVSDDKVIYENGKLKYVDADGMTEMCKCE